MPKNKREILIYTVIMCAFMVYFMSVYNVTLHQGLSAGVFSIAWMGFPPAYVVAILLDWFIVSKISKKLAFKIVDPVKSRDTAKAIAVSVFMVCGMVILMSVYGAIESVGLSTNTIMVWLTNIPKNFIAAMPLQLLIAGPLVRFFFRKAFPEGKVLA